MNILIVGATSAIAEAAARIWAGRGDGLYLAARRQDSLAAIASDLKVRGAAIALAERFDILEIDQHDALIDRAAAALGGVDCIFVAAGSLSEQAQCEREPALARRELELNGVAIVCLALAAARHLEKQGRGRLAMITSVAGVRGRATNYVYGSAKAMVCTALQGLRQRFARTSIRVTDLRPGLVDTPMTVGFRKGPLWAAAGDVGAGIVKHIDRGSAVVYLPGYWRPIMLVIRHLPEFVFRRMRF